jgi:hypothetical protein
MNKRASVKAMIKGGFFLSIQRVSVKVFNWLYYANLKKCIQRVLAWIYR